MPTPVVENANEDPQQAPSLTVTYANNAFLWNTWTSTASTASYTINTVWNGWTGTIANSSTTGSGYYYNNGAQHTRIPEASAERVAEVQRRAEEQRQRRLAIDEAEKAAEVRAAETLLSLLTEDQRVQWQREKAFELITQAGRRYRIERGVAGNISLIEDGEVTERLCAHPPVEFREEGRIIGRLPREDVVIAQMLHLQADEEDFRRVANITRVRPRRAMPAPDPVVVDDIEGEITHQEHTLGLVAGVPDLQVAA